MPPVGDERLRSLNQVAVALARGRGFDSLEVASGGRLRHRDGPDEVAAGHAREPVLLLRFGPVGQDVMSDDAVHSGSEVHAAVGQLFEHHGLMREGAAAPAVFLGDVGEEQTGLAGLGPGFAVDAMLLSPARLVRDEFLLHEAARGLAEHSQFVVHPGRLITHGEGSLAHFQGRVAEGFEEPFAVGSDVVGEAAAKFFALLEEAIALGRS